MSVRVRSAACGALAVVLAAVNGFGGQTPRPAAAAAAELQVAAQLVSYQKGYVLLTGGELFKVAPDVTLAEASGAAPKRKPQLGDFVRLTFDESGVVTQIAFGEVPFPPQASLATVERYSTLPPPVQPTGPTLMQLRNERVRVSFIVQVPTTTLPGDDIYMDTSETGWNPLAIRMDKIDSQHFRVVLDVPLGSRFRYLYTRGNSQSIERGPNGLERSPRALLIRNLESHVVLDKVEHWGDEAGNTILANPQTTPTPFNPAPYPNLPPVKINPAAPR